MLAEMNHAAGLVFGRMAVLANHDPEFRSALACVLAGLLGTRQDLEDDRVAAEEVSPPRTEPDGDTVVLPVEQTATLPVVAVTRTQRPPREPVQTDLSAIDARCRLKAEGARWAVERQRCMNEGIPFKTAIEPRDRDLIARAKQVGCFLWMNAPTAPRPADLGLLGALASCFEAAAEAAALLREFAMEPQEEDLFHQRLDVAAKAQSALRSAVTAVGAPTDTEQQSIYEWLRRTAAETGTFIERHLRADDPADPNSSADIRNCIQAVREACRKSFDRRRQQTDRVKRLRYHTKRLASGSGTDHDWHTIAQVADQLVGDGMPPSSREIRDAVLPIINTAPGSDGFPLAFRLVLREAQKYRAEQDAEQDVQPPGQDEVVLTDEVRAVRKFLEGTSLVMIGGDCRDHAQEAIKKAFALKEVDWVKSRAHQSVERFRPHIMREDVQVVLLIIRWASHGWGDIKQLCDRHGKLFVRLPGGYSPNQVADQIMAQCGRLLDKEARSCGEAGRPTEGGRVRDFEELSK